MVPSLYVIRWLWILAIQLLSSNSCGFILRLLALLECKSINATFFLHHTWSVLLIKNWTSIMHPYSISNFPSSVSTLYNEVFVLLIKNCTEQSIMCPYAIFNFPSSVRILYKVFVLLIKNWTEFMRPYANNKKWTGVSCVHMLYSTFPLL